MITVFIRSVFSETLWRFPKNLREANLRIGYFRTSVYRMHPHNQSKRFYWYWNRRDKDPTTEKNLTTFLVSNSEINLQKCLVNYRSFIFNTFTKVRHKFSELSFTVEPLNRLVSWLAFLMHDKYVFLWPPQASNRIIKITLKL